MCDREGAGKGCAERQQQDGSEGVSGAEKKTGGERVQDGQSGRGVEGEAGGEAHRRDSAAGGLDDNRSAVGRDPVDARRRPPARR